MCLILLVIEAMQMKIVSTASEKNTKMAVTEKSVQKQNNKRKVSNRCPRNAEQARSLVHCLWGCPVTLKNGLSTPLIIKHGLATWHSNFIPMQKHENTCPHKTFFIDVMAALFTIIKKMGAAKMSTNYWIHKYNVACSSSVISCSTQNNQVLIDGATMSIQFKNIMLCERS